ncbi:hypothetical protein [Vreelandella populi]|uniref:hypothetical protein n=1 Tax=Vreelandella populi TaxID=2498858 RepID=UPI000F8EC0D4|nr:hypothetical protein [Halomonas populi]RUR51303.1 hypothetical protein ELY40_15955 [Halomonas populi]
MHARANEKRAGRFRQSRQALHQRRCNGLTTYYAIIINVRNPDFAAKAKLNWTNAGGHDAKQLREIAELLSVQAKAVDNIVNYPLSVIRHYD